MEEECYGLEDDLVDLLTEGFSDRVNPCSPLVFHSLCLHLDMSRDAFGIDVLSQIRQSATPANP